MIVAPCASSRLHTSRLTPWEGQCPAPLPCRMLHQLHCPADTEAEAGAFGHGHIHCFTFWAMISLILATAWSMVMSDVSTLTLSRAIFSGASSRWESW